MSQIGGIHSAPYTAINVSLEQQNGGTIRLRMTLKINVGWSLASEMNGGNIRMTLKISGVCL